MLKTLSIAAILVAVGSTVMAAPYEGRWATEKSLCSLKKNQTGEGITTIKGMSLIGYESNCKIVKIGAPRTSVFRIQIACANEGEMGNSVLWMNMDGPNHALTSWGVEGKESGEFFRCK